MFRSEYKCPNCRKLLKDYTHYFTCKDCDLMILIVPIRDVCENHLAKPVVACSTE